MNRYQSTIHVFNFEQLDNLRKGQWVKDATGVRGQYLGKTRAGAIVIRWQNGKFGAKADTRSNHLLRQFAITNGSK